MVDNKALNARITSKTSKYTSIDDVPKELKDKLRRYITSLDNDTFVISGMPPELVGGALARYSRAPSSMKLTIINEFLDEDGEPSQEKGAQIMDRVLNAFGDESVGELEGTHVGLENISQLLTKTIEDRRIGGSPIEQSTRYVRYDQQDKYGRWRYLRPTEIMESGLGAEYEIANDHAFRIYSELVVKLSDYFKNQLPEKEFEIEVIRDGNKIKAHKTELNGEDEEKAFRIAYNFTIRCAALDVGRCVLPSSTLTQMGIFGNGRFFTNLLTVMKSGELIEERMRGEELEMELKKVIPTYIKRNRKDEKFADHNREMRILAASVLPNIQPSSEWVALLECGTYIDYIIASSLFPYTTLSLKQIISEAKTMSQQQKELIIETYIGKRASRRDRSGRGLESGYPILFELVGGFAEYRDLERHRMLTQQRQLLSCDLGFIMPSEVIEIGMEKNVIDLVEEISILNSKLRDKGLLVASQYATLFNHRIRFMLGMNLREFQHLAELRTQPAGHFSYRSMVMEMSKQVINKYPWTNGALKFVDYSDPGNKISRAKEQSKIAGKNLSSGISSDIDMI